MNTDHRVDLLVLSPELSGVHALPMAEFVARTMPGTAIVMVRSDETKQLLKGRLPAGIQAIVEIAEGPDGLRVAARDAISRRGR